MAFLVDQQAMLVDRQFLILDPLGDGLHLDAWIEAKPAMVIDVVEPEVVHVMTVWLDIAMHPSGEDEGAAQVGRTGHV